MKRRYTTEEQSENLIKLGVDVSTADMRYTVFNNNIPWVWDGKVLEKGAIPCWSESALIALLPTTDKRDEDYVSVESHCDYHEVSYMNCWDGKKKVTSSTECLFDALYEMVCWKFERENRRKSIVKIN